MRELQTVSTRDVPQTLREGIEKSDQAYTLGVPGGKPFLVLGVTPSPVKRCGVVWLVATPEVRNHRNATLNEARFWRNIWANKYDSIHNFIDTRNLLHLRWLELLGFSFGDIVYHRGVPFVFAQYTRRNHV